MILDRLSKLKRLRFLILISISVLFGSALLLVRFYHTRTTYFLFLIWNIFLAGIPLVISTSLILWKNLRQNNYLFALFLIIWLLFLPNSPYILTDIFHLVEVSGAPKWFDLLLLLNFAITGLVMYTASLFDIHQIFKEKIKPPSALLVVIAINFLCSLGIYIGRFLRWNSWELIIKPGALFKDLAEPSTEIHTYAFTLGYGTFLLLSYLMIREIRKM